MLLFESMSKVFDDCRHYHYNNEMRTIIISVLCVLFSFFLPPSVSAVSSPAAHGKLVIHFIDVGQGDASFVQLPDGTNVLIDAGSPAAGPNLVEYLRNLNIGTINGLIFTHPHDDHIGGIFSLLSAFEIERFYDNGFSNFESDLYFDYVTAVRKNLSKYRILQEGESMISHSVKIKVLNPLLPPTGNLNNDSIVLQLVYDGIRILFAGDASRPAEARLLKAATDLRSQVLKAAHHGAEDTLTEEFLDAVSPETAILSAALINRYARPHESVLDRLSERNIKVYRTDLNGHIILESDGQSITIAVQN